MNTTYQDFIWENPNCSKYAENPTAQAIFELLSQEEAIEAMKREADRINLPWAPAPCKLKPMPPPWMNPALISKRAITAPL